MVAAADCRIRAGWPNDPWHLRPNGPHPACREEMARLLEETEATIAYNLAAPGRERSGGGRGGIIDH